MNRAHLEEDLKKNELSFRAIFNWAFALIIDYFPQFVLLTVLVFLPANLFSELLLARFENVSEVVTDINNLEQLSTYMMQLIKRSALQLLINFYSMLSSATVVILIQNRLSSDEKRPFWDSFNEGIKAWLRFLLTILVVMIAFTLLSVVIVLIGVNSSMFLILGITVELIAAVILVIFMYGICFTAARQGTLLMQNIQYVKDMLKNHLGKTIGLMLLLSVISFVISYPIVTFTGTLTAMVGNPVLTILLNTVIGTVVSIVDVYVSIGMALRFFNLENLLSA